MDGLTQKHLLHIFPTFAVGGSQARFCQLVRLHGARYRHTVIALDGNYAMADRLGEFPVVFEKIDFDKRNTFASWARFRSLLRTISPDILVTYNWGSMDWAIVNRWFGKPLKHVHIEDGFGPEEATRQLRRRVWTRRLALSGRETDTVLPSRNLEKIASSQWRLPKARLHYVPNGIDCSRFATPPRTGADNGGLVIGTVATLRKEKNLSRLIKAFSSIADRWNGDSIQLIIVGDGPERPVLEQLAVSTRAQISFAGQSTRPEDWLNKMDIFALSSDTEQMPLGVLEAMAAGLPVVSTAVGDVAMMVAGANAPLVVSPADFEKALETLADDAALRQQIGAANAKRAAELFDEKVMAARYAELIG